METEKLHDEEKKKQVKRYTDVSYVWGNNRQGCLGVTSIHNKKGTEFVAEPTKTDILFKQIKQGKEHGLGIT